jgi:4-hydroxybenzoate polyprenyltransferase
MKIPKLKHLLLFIRPYRTFHYIAITSLGAIMAGITNYFSFVFAILTSAMGWQFSVFVNDYFDVEADLVNKRIRPLTIGVVTKKQTILLMFISSIVTILLSILSSPFNLIPFFSTIFCLSLGIAYSAPPLRFKKYPITASLVVAIATFLIFLIGYFSQSSILSAPSINFIIIISIVVALGINVKDLWDMEGDKAGGLLTLPILLGEEKGKYATILLNLLGLLVFTTLILDSSILDSSLIIFLTFIFIIASYMILNFKKYKYRDVLIIFYIGILAVIVKMFL